MTKLSTVDVLLISRLGRNDGGRETWLYNFLPRFLERNRDVNIRILGIRDPSGQRVEKALRQTVNAEAAQRLSVHQFDVKKRRYPVFFQMWWLLRKFTKERSFDAPQVVIGMGIFELAMILSASYRSSRRIIWLRGIFLDEKSNRFPRALRPLLGWLEIKALKRVNLVLSNGHDIASHYRVRGIDMPVIENGVDLDRWQCDQPIKLPLDVAFIGRLSEIKGISEFIEAAIQIKRGAQAHEFSFHIIGEGPYAATEKFLTAQEYFRYHGAVPNVDLPEVLPNIDICVALTRSGGSGGGGGTSNALLEQMAAGRVIVAWDNPMYRQLLDERSGYLAKQDDVAALVEMLYAIRRDIKAASEKSAAAVNIMKDYSIDAQVARFEALLAKECRELGAFISSN